MTIEEAVKIFEDGVKDPKEFEKEYALLYVKPMYGDSFNINVTLLQSLKSELKKHDNTRYDRILKTIKSAQRVE